MITDSDAKEIFIIAAAVAGSLEKNNLSVDLNNNNTQTFRYHLAAKKWVRDGSISIPASAAKQASPEEKVIVPTRTLVEQLLKSQSEAGVKKP